MNSLLYGLALLGMLVILHWYITNDGNGQNDGSTGLLAMNAGGKPRAATPEPESPTGKRSFRRKK
jgi:hypothetical protein